VLYPAGTVTVPLLPYAHVTVAVLPTTTGAAHTSAAKAGGAVKTVVTAPIMVADASSETRRLREPEKGEEANMDTFPYNYGSSATRWWRRRMTFPRLAV
jgi:hypothetical protein